jgi:hypothetical protein
MLPSASPAVNASWGSVAYSVHLHSGTFTPGTFSPGLSRQHLTFPVAGGALIRFVFPAPFAPDAIRCRECGWKSTSQGANLSVLTLNQGCRIGLKTNGLKLTSPASVNWVFCNLPTVERRALSRVVRKNARIRLFSESGNE